MKAGANRTDIAKIAKLAESGEDANHISYVLQIQPDVVKKFMPKKKESKSKSKLADTSKLTEGTAD